MSGRASALAAALLPGALLVYLAFNAGGFFPGTQAVVAIALLLVLATWIAFSKQPFLGASIWMLVCAGALVLLSGWALLSGIWSDAPARGLLDAQRPLIYALAVVVFGLLIRDPKQLRWSLWSVLGAFAIVCGAALVTRLLPDVWTVVEPDSLNQERLSYPVTYWNGLGLIAALGVLFAFHLACQVRGPWLARILGAGAVPIFATTIYFTFSRGGVVAAVIALAVYLLVARPRGALTALIAAAAPTALALSSAYGADLLASDNPTVGGAISQGHEVGWALTAAIAGAIALRAALLVLDRRLAAVAVRRFDRRTKAIAACTLVAVAAGGALIAGAPGWVDRELDSFTDEPPGTPQTDARQRFSRVDSNGRFEYWEVSLDQFSDNQLLGGGADTFTLAWEQQRPFPGDVLNSHSLYLETLGELGLVGAVLLGTALGALLVGIATRLRGDQRPIYAVLLSAGLAWGLHAVVDWDWDLPVVTIWLFALGGAALASRNHGTPKRGPLSAWVRLPLAALLVLLAVGPYTILSSQAWLDRGEDAFERRDCAAAADAARSSIDALGIRPEPYQLLSYCAIRARQPRIAIARSRQAIANDPSNSDLIYDLALARAAAGHDPQPQLRRALALNPLDEVVEETLMRLRVDDPALRRQRALEIVRRFTSL